MAKERRTLLEKVFPLEEVGWRLPSFIAAIVTIVVAGGAVWVWFRDQAEDVLTAEVAVWRVLVAIGAVLVLVVAGVAALVASGRVLTIGPSRPATAKTDRPREIDHFGVKWPIEWPLHGGVYVGRPMCPRDRSTLGHVMEINDSDGDIEFRDVRPLPEKWEGLHKELMLLECFKDKSTYDLRGYGFTMSDAVKVIEGLAWGELRTARVHEG